MCCPSSAQETADIIAAQLPALHRTVPDPLLNEGRPAHNIPCHKHRPAQHHDRIEKGFQKYFHRNTITSQEGELPHEFEIIVCHANVIRYFVCRSLQLPPEAWLRFLTFNCSLTHIVIRPNGNVSVWALGDVGHLEPSQITFSQRHGLAW